MRKTYFMSLYLLGMAMGAGSFSADAQITVNKIQYTLSTDGTAYAVTGFEEGIVSAVIESAIDGKPVTTINKNVFKSADALKRVSIPSSVTKMGNSIFQNNKTLETVTFEDGEQPLAMGGWTFNGCTSLKEIELPGRLASFGANSNFNGCTSLEKVVFNGDCRLSDMKQYTFENTDLKELDLSGLSEVTTFNANCLQNLKSTSVKVILPKKMVPLPKNVLKNCVADVIVYPEGASEIPQQAFDAYAHVMTVSIPSTVTGIGQAAFRNCGKLEKIDFAYNPVLNSSMNYCFEGCTSLENVDMSPLPGIKGLVATFMNSGLRKITFGSDSRINTLNWDVFNGTRLESIDIPETVTKLGARAFYNCQSLETVRIPEGVREILSDAFGHTDGNTGVKTVIFSQHGGRWPAAVENDVMVSILAADTRAYCYKDVTDIPEGVTTVAPIKGAGYCTYFSSTAISIPDDVVGTVITGVISSDLVCDYGKFTGGSILPANTPVLLACGEMTGTIYPGIEPDVAEVYEGDNYLVGSENDTYIDVPAEKVAYVLVKGADGLFSFDRRDETMVDNQANSAVLIIPSSLAVNVDQFRLGRVATGIGEISADNVDRDAPVYNLMGIEVKCEDLTPGIYVSDGKKFIVR